MNNFTRLTIVLVIGLAGIGSVLAFVSYQKFLRTDVSNLYAIQRKYNQSNDRIVKTNAFLEDQITIFESSRIQTFSEKNGKLLVGVGQKNEKTDLYLVDVISKKSTKIDIPEGLVTQIQGGGGLFIFTLEKIVEGYPDFKGILNILDTNTLQITNPNPQGFAQKVTNLHVSNDGQLLLFSGFGSYHYVMDLNNIENITKIKTKMNYSTGFDSTSTKILAAQFDKKDFKLVDVVTGEEESQSLPTDRFKDVTLSNTSKDVYFTVKNAPDSDMTSQLYKLQKLGFGDILKSDISSLELPKLDSTDRFIAVEKYSKSEINDTSDFRIAGLRARPASSTIIIFDTRTKKLIDNNFKAIDLVWES